MYIHGLLKYQDCQLQNTIKCRKMYNNIISDSIEFLTYFFLYPRENIWLKVEGNFIQNLENSGPKWGNLQIRGKEDNIETFVTSPQILIFNTASAHQRIIKNVTDLILSHT